MKSIIVIPARMSSTRFPNKPMALIDGMPMIQRVWIQALNSKVGDVLVACCEDEVFDLITSLGGKAIMTKPNLPSGTDRIYEAIKNYNSIGQFDSIINLQGDMPIFNSHDIAKVNKPLIQGFDIGTLVTNLSYADEKDQNVTKAYVEWITNNKLGEAKDFFKSYQNKLKNIYHHVGIYSFSLKILKRFIELEQSENEIYHKLEQLRALDSNMSIGVSYVKNVPLSVDTKEDLIKVESIIKQNHE